VTTWVGGAEREILHPSVQVRQYQLYLEDSHTAFQEGGIQLSSCAYLHNYCAESDDIVLAKPFSDALKVSPLFTADDVETLSNYIAERVRGGNGLNTLACIEQGKYRPSKKLMDHVGGVIKGRHEYVLLDEQLVVYEKVRSCAKRGFHDRRKAVLIIKGGPGTGKSVIAINLLSDLLLDGYNVHYATGSKAFTETLRKIIGSRAAVQFKYFNSYGEANANDIDVLICDEAHRLRTNSANRFTPRARRSKKTQIQEVCRLRCFRELG
jgi:DNA replication protein DnaC